jgi:membrane fusion protein, multidrug efflux system
MNMLVTDTVDTLQSAPPTISDRIRGLSARMRLVLGILGIVLLAAIVWAIFAPAAAPKKKPAPPVIVQTATKADIPVIEHTIGTVISPATVQITARVQGQLLKAYFQEGQVVHTGDLLFLIDPAPFQAALAQANGNLAKDQASFISAEHDAVRYSTLAKQGAASTQQRDQAVAAAGALAATIAADRAAVQVAQLNLSYTQIRSPINGKTGPILIQPGNQVVASGSNTGASALVTITQVQPIKVSFALPQTDLPRIQARLRAHELTVGVGPGNKLTAPVNFVSNQVNAQTGTIELRATFPNDNYELVPGQLLDSGVVLDILKGATVVPHDAVNAGLESSYVYVVRDGNAVMVNVKVLNDNGIVSAVQGALKPGEKVITDGQMRVVAGNPVVLGGKPQDKNIGK